MTRLARVKYAFKFIRTMAASGKLEMTQSRFVASTYGVEQSLIKKMKARFRNELSFAGEGK